MSKTMTLLLAVALARAHIGGRTDDYVFPEYHISQLPPSVQ